LRRKLPLGLLSVAVVFGAAWLLFGQRVTDVVRMASLPSNREIVDRYCVDCHNSQERVAGLALDTLDPEHVAADVETWESVIRKVRVGQMPKHDANVSRADAAGAHEMTASLEKLTSSLETQIDRLSGAGPAPGRPLLGRLNRAEYANAIRDLLGLDVDVSLLLPPDDSAYGFDNVADVLGNSPALLQSYLTAARRIGAMAVGDPSAPPDGTTYTARQDLSQDRYMSGLPLGTVGGMSTTHIFPVDGEYEFQLRLYRTNLSAIRGLEDPHQVELTIDGQRILLSEIGGDADLVALQANPTDASDALETERLRIRVAVGAGQREVAAAFLGESPAVFDTSRLQPFVRDFNPYDAEGAPHVQSITIEGPFNVVASDSGAAPSEQLFVCRPSSPAEEAPCARRILTSLATRAYRRPVTEGDLEGLLSFYERERAHAGFAAGIQMALRRVLASPSFVFLPEHESADLAPGDVYAITDFELATRLALFLWSSIPDDELLRVAGEGRLRDPDVLAAQVHRMLAAPQSAEFTRNFAGQWLHLRNLAGIVPNSELFPNFDHNLREALRREAELFFASVLHEDRSALDLLRGDYTFVNDRLARHYGLEGVFSSDFRRVRLADEARHGLLGKGAVLLATSHPNTTSPVLRGKWVLENILGTPPPPPPPDVDTALRQTEPGAEPQTMREQMERHWANPACAGCHSLMDPIGFALENFDVTGAWQETNDTGAAPNTAGVMFDGTEIDGAVDVHRALLQRPEVFVQTLTEKLMVYALRRGLTYEDMPLVRKIVSNVRDEDYRLSAVLLEIVQSAPFQMRIKSAGQGSAASQQENL
jgi:hypothetical protein